MAEAMLLGVAKSVVGQLSSPALKEALLVLNFEKDLKRLGETVETITCFIHDAEQRQSNQLAVKLWLSRLKVVLYDADDLFDAIAARALRKKAKDGSKFKKEVTLFFSKSNQLAFVIKTAHDIKDIRECLDCIKDDMSQFHFQYQRVEEKRSHSVLEREERHSFVDDKDVIGRDQEKKDIISLLLHLHEDRKEKNLEVISVIGFGGLGKTTLAQLVYNDQRVQKGFDTCLWTCINYFSDLESVLVTILTSALNSKPRDLGLDQLQRELREKIQGKKFLLVLDDVWDENASNWGKLETLLSCGKSGSKVLITTRKTKVAQCLDASEPYYRLNTLSKESAWSLFVKMAFKDGEFDGDDELVLVGKQIIHKCGYVPLALSTIGRMLRYKKKDKEEWLSFLEKEFAEVVSSDANDGNLMQVLKVSYNDLPLALKYCFAYCSVFPKDRLFNEVELVRMWIAQGFVESHPKKSLEEIGHDYFFYMVDRCFFQGVVIFKMHDLLHDLAIQVAESGSNSVSDKELGEMVALHHISVTCLPNGSFEFSNLSSPSKSLRTLRFVDAKHIQIKSLELVLDRFRKLRTLVLSFGEFGTLPNIFDGLIHLRYLDLSSNYNLTALPNSICKLYHLQTLLLNDCFSLVRLPSNLGKLVSLRHIALKGCSKLDSMPSGFAALTTLVSLDRLIVHPSHGGLRYLGRLDELCGTLTLELPECGWIDCVEDAKKAKLQSKCRLSGLSIVCPYSVGETQLPVEERRAVIEQLQPHANIQYLQIKYYISDKLPSWFSSLCNIKKLCLGNCDLEYLDVSVSCGYLLPRLEDLILCEMPRLRGWWSGVTSASPRDNAPISTVVKLPRVSKLKIESCANLVENMPVFEAVQEMVLEGVNVGLVNMLLGNPERHDYNSKLQVLELTRIEGLECLSEGSINHLTALKRLEIQHCENLRLVSMLLSCPQRQDCSSKLQELRLSGISGLECLSEGSIKHLTALKKLTISYCENLRWVSRRGLACLTSLEVLRIIECGGVRLEDEEDDKRPYSDLNSNMCHGLQKLRHLHMPWECHFLREELPLLSSLQSLSIDYYEEKQVEADNQDLECCTSIWWQGFNNLERVTLSFGSMACCFPEWVLHLPCLKSLYLESCGEMNTDDWVARQTQFKSLECLEDLRIFSNKELLWVNDIPWDLVPSLCTLSIDSRMNSIPPGIQKLASLRSLQFADCRGIKEIPEWMMNLTSLQQLRIERCSPELKARCEPETGTDWHLVSHIPSIKIEIEIT